MQFTGGSGLQAVTLGDTVLCSSTSGVDVSWCISGNRRGFRVYFISFVAVQCAGFSFFSQYNSLYEVYAMPLSAEFTGGSRRFMQCHFLYEVCCKTGVYSGMYFLVAVQISTSSKPANIIGDN